MVGGALRDAALGRDVTDLDLACAGDAEGLARRIAADAGGTLVVLDEGTRTYRVALPGGRGQADVAALEKGSLEADLARRDFPVNAMARRVSLESGRTALGELVDPRSGRRDIAGRRLRVDDPKVLRDDPLRLLRAFRIAAQLGFSIDERSLGAIKAHRARVRRPAGERVRYELLALLSVPDAHRWLRLMDRARLLTALFPELEKSRACARGYYGAGGVLRHTLDAVERMDYLLERLPKVFPGLSAPIREQLRAWGGPQAEALLRLGVLLHDIAKPATAKKIGGRLRFFGHDAKGARMTRRELERLRFSRREIDGVAATVLHHLRPGHLATNPVITPKAVFRYFRDLGDDGVPGLLVCWADFSSYMPRASLRAAERGLMKDPGPPPADPDESKTVRHLRIVSLLLKSWFLKAETVRPTRLLDGHAVMKAAGIAPGPAVGKLLGMLEEAQAEGSVRDRDSALAFVRKAAPKVK